VVEVVDGGSEAGGEVDGGVGMVADGGWGVSQGGGEMY
jgi:hypothetical protein